MYLIIKPYYHLNSLLYLILKSQVHKGSDFHLSIKINEEHIYIFLFVLLSFYYFLERNKGALLLCCNSTALSEYCNIYLTSTDFTVNKKNHILSHLLKERSLHLDDDHDGGQYRRLDKF